MRCVCLLCVSLPDTLAGMLLPCLSFIMVWYDTSSRLPKCCLIEIPALWRSCVISHLCLLLLLAFPLLKLILFYAAVHPLRNAAKRLGSEEATWIWCVHPSYARFIFRPYFSLPDPYCFHLHLSWERSYRLFLNACQSSMATERVQIFEEHDIEFTSPCLQLSSSMRMSATPRMPCASWMEVMLMPAQRAQKIALLLQTVSVICLPCMTCMA
jgi:hypothetical protein